MWVTLNDAEEHHGVSAASLRVLMGTYRKAHDGQLPEWAKRAENGRSVLVDIDFLNKVPRKVEKLKNECCDMLYELIDVYETCTGVARKMSELTGVAEGNWASFLRRDIYAIVDHRKRRTTVSPRLIRNHKTMKEHLTEVKA